MSDDFIPLNQSTPHGKPYQGGNQPNSGHHNRFRGRKRRGGHDNKWGNNSRTSSFGSDNNSSFSQDRHNIDAYLHPSMLEDPWAKLRKQQNR